MRWPDFSWRPRNYAGGVNSPPAVVVKELGQSAQGEGRRGSQGWSIRGNSENYCPRLFYQRTGGPNNGGAVPEHDVDMIAREQSLRWRAVDPGDQ
jgi:hypothetical protein